MDEKVDFGSPENARFWRDDVPRVLPKERPPEQANFTASRCQLSHVWRARAALDQAES